MTFRMKAPPKPQLKYNKKLERHLVYVPKISKTQKEIDVYLPARFLEIVYAKAQKIQFSKEALSFLAAGQSTYRLFLSENRETRRLSRYKIVYGKLQEIEIKKNEGLKFLVVKNSDQGFISHESGIYRLTTNDLRAQKLDLSKLDFKKSYSFKNIASCVFKKKFGPLFLLSVVEISFEMFERKGIAVQMMIFALDNLGAWKIAAIKASGASEALTEDGGGGS